MHISEVEYSEVLKLRHEVMYPDKDIDFVKLPDDDKGLHFGVFEDDKPICVVSIFMEGRSVQIRKLATRVDMQGKGYASSMMKWLIDYAKDVKLDSLWCNARVGATNFYKKFDLQETDKRFQKNGHEYVIMERKF